MNELPRGTYLPAPEMGSGKDMLQDIAVPTGASGDYQTRLKDATMQSGYRPSGEGTLKNTIIALLVVKIKRV